MNKKKLMSLVASLCLVALIGVGASLAYMTDNETAQNTITMGHVNIDLDEPNFAPGTGGTIENVTPGQSIVKDPTITVVEGSEKAYVRASIEVEGLSKEHKETLLSKNEDGSFKYLDINTTDWKEVNGLFYYVGGENNGVLTAKEAVVLFSEVKIPSAWGNEMANKSFTITVKAEAIQADNFTPSEVNGEYGWFADNEAVTTENYETLVD